MGSLVRDVSMASLFYVMFGAAGRGHSLILFLRDDCRGLHSIQIGKAVKSEATNAQSLQRHMEDLS